MNYSTAIAGVLALSHGSAFTLFPSGTIREREGRIEDFGSGTLAGEQGVAPSWARLGYVRYQATAGGEIVFELAPGDLPFSRFGLGNVPDDQVHWGASTLKVSLSDGALTVADVDATGRANELVVLLVRGRRWWFKPPTNGSSPHRKAVS